MRFLSTFICYRQVDGSALAVGISKLLHGRSISVQQGSFNGTVPISVYHDNSTPATEDWECQHKAALEQSRAFIILCTPGIKAKLPQDWVHYEINWWLKNKPTTPPIVITALSEWEKWMPNSVIKNWPNLQVIKIEGPLSRNNMEGAITRILPAISDSSRCGDLKVAEDNEFTPLDSITGLYRWEKDRYFRYVNCNENYARAAGFDSPKSVIGKNDDDMPWWSLGDFFRQGDQEVIDGKSPPRENIEEVEIMVDRTAEILVTETQLIDSRGACIGVQGYFIDITGQKLVPQDRLAHMEKIDLGEDFGNELLLQVEMQVLRGIILRIPVEQVAKDLGITTKEVDGHLTSLMKKLQCKNIREIITISMRSGLLLRVLDFNVNGRFK